MGIKPKTVSQTFRIGFVKLSHFLFRFLSVGTAITDNAQHSVSGQRQNAKVESGLVFDLSLQIYVTI